MADVTTGSDGAYALASASGDVVVAPVVKYGSPRISDVNGGITSFDASVIARAGVGLLTLSQNQTIAADVTGDGTTGGLDASEVARFAAGLLDHFTVAVARGSDWKFLRCDAYAFPGDPGCGLPAYNFTPISGAQTGKNFYAVLYGEVTGNWQPVAGFTSAAASLASAEEQQAAVEDRQLAERLERDRPLQIARSATSPEAQLLLSGWAGPLRAGQRRQLTVRLQNADGILGLDLSLRYDPSRIAIVSVETTGIGSGFASAHADLAGTHRIAAYGVIPLSGSGAVLNVTIEALKGTGRQVPLQLSGVANEGRIPLRVREGIQLPRDRR